MTIMAMHLGLALMEPFLIAPRSCRHVSSHSQYNSFHSAHFCSTPPTSSSSFYHMPAQRKATGLTRTLGTTAKISIADLRPKNFSSSRSIHKQKNVPTTTVASSTGEAAVATAEEGGGEVARKNNGGRPVVILPGLGNNSADYDDIVGKLMGLGLAPTVARVSRPDWLRNALGLLDGAYWRGTLRPRPVLDWYLERVFNAIAKAKASTTDSRKVALVGHSAGGWLARVFMAEFGTQDIDLLLTLGTPHLPPPRGVPGVIDQTRGLLYHVEENCPGAYHPEVKYVTVAGRFVRGERLFRGEAPVATTGLGTVASPSAVAAVVGMEEGGPTAPESPPQNGVAAAKEKPSFQAWVVGQGYKQVCGDAIVWGDGVVPERAAHLEGAINITIDGVYHSPVGAQDEGRPWYGSSNILEKWVDHLLD